MPASTRALSGLAAEFVIGHAGEEGAAADFELFAQEHRAKIAELVAAGVDFRVK
jgi:hypothetical protein